MCRNVSPSVPGAHVQVRSFMFLDQQVMLTGFSGGTGKEKNIYIQHKRGMKWQSSEIQPVVMTGDGTSVPRSLCHGCECVCWGGLSSCLHPSLPAPHSGAVFFQQRRPKKTNPSCIPS